MTIERLNNLSEIHLNKQNIDVDAVKTNSSNNKLFTHLKENVEYLGGEDGDEITADHLADFHLHLDTDVDGEITRDEVIAWIDANDHGNKFGTIDEIFNSLKSIFTNTKTHTDNPNEQPRVSDKYNKNIDILIEQGMYEDAVIELDKAIESDPHYGKWARSGKKHPLRMVAQYDKEIKLDPKNFIAYNNKGVWLDDLEKYDEAIACYDKAIELKPDNAAAYYNKGIALRNLEKYDEAIACYDKAIELEPDNAAAYYNKGIALRNLEKYDEAIACYDKAIELEPDNAAAYYNKGIALQKHGNLDEAIEAYDEALKLDPSNEEAKKLKEQAEYGIANAPELDNPSFE